MATRRLEVVISGDSTSVEKAFKRTTDAADGTASKMDGAAKKAGGAIVAAFATDQLVNFGGQLLSLGGELAAIDTKVKTVFEGQAGTIREWANQNNEAFGLTDDKLAGLAANFGDLLKPMGFTSDQAATMSKDVVGLAGALSAWSGGTVSSAQAAEILSSAMLGERDSLKSLGIAISEADVDARLAAKGQSELTGQAREMAEAVATQELIFEKSTDAQKAWAEGGNDALKAQNKMSASFGEMKEKLATALVPVIVKATAALFALGDWMSKNKTVVMLFGAGILAALVPAFVAWATAAGAAAIATIAAAAPVIALGVAIGALALLVVTHWDTIKAAFSTAIEAVKGFISGAIGWIKQNWDLVLGILTGPIGLAVLAIRTHWDSIVSFITGLPGRIASAARGMWDGIVNAFKSAINAIIRMWNNLRIPSFKIGGYDIPGPGPNVPSFHTPEINFPDIPYLHSGGIFNSGQGQGLAMLEDGEGVFTRGQMGAMGGTTVNVYVQGSMLASSRDVMNAVEEGVRRGVRPGDATRKAFAV